MKISELTSTWESMPSVEHVYESEIVHIIERRGGYKPDKYRRQAFGITNCNRLLKFARSVHALGGWTLCSRCGDRAAFEDALDHGKIQRAEFQAARDRERELEYAEFRAAKAWDETYHGLRGGLDEYLIELAEDGKVLIPIREVDLDLLRSIVEGFMNAVEKKSMKDETLIQTYYHSRRLLEEVLIT